jgi:hypothetical protein
MKEVMVDMTEFVPKGHLNGVSREELHIITGMPDRDIRAAITWTTFHIEPVYSFNGSYFRYKNKSDLPYINDYIGQEEARVRTLKKKIKALRRG